MARTRKRYHTSATMPALAIDPRRVFTVVMDMDEATDNPYEDYEVIGDHEQEARRLAQAVAWAN